MAIRSVERFFSGQKVVTEEAGSGIPLLCLHGLGLGAHVFRDLENRLQDHYCVVALDLPGLGVNVVPGAPFSLPHCEDVLAGLLNEHFSEPAFLLGHSMGAILAMRLAIQCPRRIRGLILVNGIPEVTPGSRERLALRADELETKGLAGFGPRVTRANFAADSIRKFPDIVAEFERNFESLPLDQYTQTIRELLRYSAVDCLPNLTVPCLVICGEEDLYAPPEAIQAFLARLPGSVESTAIPGCGHLPFFEAPERFAAIVKSYLDSQAKVTG